MWKTVYFLYSKFQKKHNSFQKLTQSDDTRTCSVVHQNKVMCKISAQYLKACRRKVRKTGGRTETRTDGWTDGESDGRTSPYHNNHVPSEDGRIISLKCYQCLQKQRYDIKHNCCPLWSLVFSLLFIHQMDIF